MNYWKIIELANWKEDKDYKEIGTLWKKILKPEIIEETEKFYSEKLSEIKEVLETHALEKTGKRYGYYGVSDDGFWDLSAHIIGLGEDFYNRVLQNPEIAKELADNRDYEENFGYIFQYATGRN